LIDPDGKIEWLQSIRMARSNGCHIDATSADLTSSSVTGKLALPAKVPGLVAPEFCALPFLLAFTGLMRMNGG
jgi:hypothetical protein